MTDHRLRLLERRWKESGNARDEGAYLLERVRAGTLAARDLELAAYLGHAPAREALGASAPEAPAELDRWVYALEPWGAHLCVLAALVSVRFHPEWGALRRFEVPPARRPRAQEQRTELTQGVAACAACIACPCPEHWSALREWSHLDWSRHLRTLRQLPAPCAGAITLCYHLTRLARLPTAHQPAEFVSHVAPADAGLVRGAAREALLPWALVRDGSAEAER